MDHITQFLNNAQSGQGAPILVNGQLMANANSTLRHEEHVRYDDALLMVATERMRVIADIRSAGLVKSVGGLGVLLSMYERAGELTGGVVNMDGRTRSDNDRLTFDEVGVPIPIFSKQWELGARQLEASRTTGAPLSTTQVEITGRVILEDLERHVFQGLPDLEFSGQRVYGLCTHPDRNVYTIQADWRTAADGAAIVNDALKMVEILQEDRMYGPYVLYVCKAFWTNLQKDYAAAKGDNTILQRIEAIREISKVEVADFLEDGQMTMVQMTSDVLDLAVAADLQNLQWSAQPMSTDFMTYAAMAIRVKSEKNQRCGVCHASE